MACRLQSDLSTLIGNLQVINSWGGLYLHCESMWEHSFFYFPQHLMSVDVLG